MPPLNNNPDEFSVGLNNLSISSLDSFKEKLERSFFATAIIRSTVTEANKVNLVLELNCNYELSQMLYHYNLGTWGNSGDGTILFSDYVTQLGELNHIEIEIEELSFHYENTSIIINKIYKNSISEQFNAILQKLNENFNSITKNYSIEPYEIYIPVFEEKTENCQIPVNDYFFTDYQAIDYFKYWALYFEGKKNAEIYDVRDTKITAGKLYYLNHL